MNASTPIPAASPSTVIAKALLSTASRLGLSQRETARIIGVSEATMSRIAMGRAIDAEAKEAELALLLVRVFRSLDALVGGDEAKARAWFQAKNAHVGGIPAERVRTVEGLVHVASYLDAMRGKL
jgi:transcriptional regulator with XRE-family HTH domain